MAADIYFRTSLSGYNKKDVMRFIEKLNKEQVERVSDLNDKIRVAQTEARKLALEIETVRKRCDEVETMLSDREQNDVVNEEKAQKFDSMQGTYADIMLDAEHSAKEKIATANKEAEEILRQANALFEEKMKEIDRIIENSKSEFMAVAEKMTASLDKAMNNSKGE